MKGLIGLRTSDRESLPLKGTEEPQNLKSNGDDYHLELESII